LQLYAITDRSLLSIPRGSTGPAALGTVARRWAEAGVAYIQVREKDLSTDELAAWSEAVVKAAKGTSTRVLINGTPRSAIAINAHGVHLPAGWTADAIRAARNVFDQHKSTATISVACHSDAEVVRARDLGADFRDACRLAAPLPIFALGGVTAANAQQCVDAGAAGIAAIRLFMGSAEGWRALL
jgi:thiamine-phosphate pyrophosphorylase